MKVKLLSVEAEQEPFDHVLEARGLDGISEVELEVTVGDVTLRFVVNETYWRVRREHEMGSRAVAGGDQWIVPDCERFVTVGQR